MPSLANLPGRIAGQPLTKAIYDQLEASHDYLVVAGADLASAATIVPTNEFHKVTGAVTIDNIDHAAEVAGQQVRLWFSGAPRIRNNGGGAGNIRLRGGRDKNVIADEIVTFVYDGALWREQTPRAGGTGAFHAYISANQSITNSTWTKVLFNSEDFDLEGWYDSGAAARFSPSVGRYYRINARISFATISANAQVTVALYKGGVLHKILGRLMVNAQTDNCQVGGSALVDSSISDYWEIFVHHADSVARNILGGSTLTYFDAELVHLG